MVHILQAVAITIFNNPISTFMQQFSTLTESHHTDIFSVILECLYSPICGHVPWNIHDVDVTSSRFDRIPPSWIH